MKNFFKRWWEFFSDADVKWTAVAMNGHVLDGGASMDDLANDSERAGPWTKISR